MMKITRSIYNAHRYSNNVIAMGMSAIMTTLLCSSVTSQSQASDIDIYKEASTANITLMFMLDISGSMTLDQVGESACDIPSTYTYSNTGSDASTTSRPYTRYYCNAVSPSTKKYLYRTQVVTTGSGWWWWNPTTTTQYQVCTNQASTISGCVWSAVTNTSPTLSLAATGSEAYQGDNQYTYYYNSGAVEKFYDRITRVKDGMYDLLQGSSTVTRLSDDKVIGLSAFSYASNGRTGYIVVPARRLDAVVGNSTQRQVLLNAIANLTAGGGTPTANAYADTAAYLMGTTTSSGSDLQAFFVSNQSQYNGWYKACVAWSGSTCTSWQPAASNSWYSGYDYSSQYSQGSYSANAFSLKGYYYTGPNPYSGFPYSSSDSKRATNYIQPTSLSAQTSTTSQCSGQGIYVLTDGEPNGSGVSIAQPLMQTALGSYGNVLTCSGTLFTDSSTSNTGWQCISDFSQLLLNRNNPSGAAIKTAVVGFGSDFNGLTSYSSALTQAQNITNINNSSASTNVKNAAKWGVYAGGGWYSGASSADVVASVNGFIGQLTTNIPPVTTGAATIPVDVLNPSALQNYAYFSQFQPTPGVASTPQLWQGNLKKYNVLNGLLVDRDNNAIVNSSGRIVDNKDVWSTGITDQTMALVGGAKAKLNLGLDSSDVVKRKVLINRDSSGDATDTTLNQITTSYLSSSDTDRAYLLSLLGYNIDPANTPTTLDGLRASSELRQLGAVMHSSPILLTNQGKISADSSGALTSSDRQDYILFGTTQGLLHVVDATTGVEKFAFVPNEMVQTQKKAFLKYDTTSGGTNKMFYGVDAPWTNYSEYVPTTAGVLTVGEGLNGASGKQIAYGGLRMGGRSYYALDLHDTNSPSMLFHVDPNDQRIYSSDTTVNSTTYPELQYMGQSWSKPSVGWVRWNGTKRLVMFVGGGYDAGGTDGDGIFDTDGSRAGYAGYEGTSASDTSYTQTNRKGAGVYMFDALTGQLLWWAGANATAANTSAGVQNTVSTNMQYSVVSQIRTVDRNSDGLIDHLYFGDLGGQVWRIDLNNSAPALSAFAKTPVRLLNLNKGAYSPRFYEMPAFTIYRASGQTFAVISIGSGNRSRPLFESNVPTNGDTTTYQTSAYNNDAVYNIFDKDVARSTLFDYTTSTTGSGSNTVNSYTYTVSADAAATGNRLQTIDLNLTNSTVGQKLVALGDSSVSSAGGWYYYLASNKIQSEKILSTPITINSDMYVTSFDASRDGLAGDCGAGIKGESYVRKFCMPYGACSGTIVRRSIGVGVISPSVGSSTVDGTGRVLIASAATLANGNTNPFSPYTPTDALIPIRWYETSQ